MLAVLGGIPGSRCAYGSFVMSEQIQLLLYHKNLGHLFNL
jgi:hypothetical protein